MAATLSIVEFRRYKGAPGNQEIPTQLTNFSMQIRGCAPQHYKKPLPEPPKRLQKNETFMNTIIEIINKLNKNNFNEMLAELSALEMSPKNAADLIDLIVRRAVADKKFGEVYAQLTAELWLKISSAKDELVSQLDTYYAEMLALPDNFTDVDASPIFQIKDHITSFTAYIGRLYNACIIDDIKPYFTALLDITYTKPWSVICICELMRTVSSTMQTLQPDDYTVIVEQIKVISVDKKVKNKERFAVMELLDKL